jgi:hypothetical protein
LEERDAVRQVFVGMYDASLRFLYKVLRSIIGEIEAKIRADDVFRRMFHTSKAQGLESLATTRNHSKNTDKIFKPENISRTLIYVGRGSFLIQR